MQPQYTVEPKSREELRYLAVLLRRKLGMEDAIYFPIVKVLDIMCDLRPNFSYEIVEDSKLPDNVHADTDIVHETIRIRESVYNGACDENGRDRMTIAHEICHYFTLVEYGFKLQRRFSNTTIKAYEDPEWQAKCMAGELMIPKGLTQGMNSSEIMIKCGVSNSAANYQYLIYRRESM